MFPKFESATDAGPKRAGRFETIGLFGGSALLAIAGIVVALQFVQPAPPTIITIAAGTKDGAYIFYAEQYAEILAKDGIELRVLETNGSVDNLELLLRDAEPVDLALIQGGVADDEQRKRLTSLGSMFYEPVWLLVPAGASVPLLNQVKGARIGIGPERSGTRYLALLLLQANGIDAKNAHLETAHLNDTAERLADGQLDLIFVVRAEKSPLLHRLAIDGAIELQDLPRARAYARHFRFLTALDLPTGGLDLEHNIPQENLNMLAVTANLVARPDIHPALVDLLIEAATEVHGTGGLFAEPGTFPTPRHADFPLSTDARRYYENGPSFLQRYLPFWAATWIDRTKVMLLPLVALLLPLVKILPPVYRWRIRRRIYRWYAQLRQIDLEIETSVGVDSHALGERLAEIESETAQIEIPLSYNDQLYDLRLHIRLLQQKLERVC
ncbi:MAG: ABC transporter substrate-binding protein [Chromatiaceae bacterium]|nr:ABC transporter substrate-binding protein [Chromatiaceae bacterium]